MHIPAITESAAYTPVSITRPSTSNQAIVTHTKLDLPRLDLAKIELPTRESLAHDTASFAEDVGKKFREAGVRVPPNPILGSDYEGSVRVVSEHPDKDKIEKIFKDNPDLQQRYAKISVASGLIRATEHHRQFASEYQRLKNNPTAQRALVEAEIARNQAPFYLTVTAEGAETFFGLSRTSA